MIIAVIVAIAVPIAFLALVRWLDLYASGSFKLVLLCFMWGSFGAFFLSLGINTSLVSFFGVGLLLVRNFIGPIVEELTKSVIVIYAERRPDFTYFVDGAIYGFASGTAFAVFENLFYISNSHSVGLMVALSRGFSTSLMHGSASALVGVALGRLRYGHGISRIISPIVGWAGAIALHMTYNNVVDTDMGAVTLIAVFMLALLGVGITAGFIFWGLHEEQQWLRDTLGLNVGVSEKEAQMVQKMDSLDTLLDPISKYFGEEKRKKVERILNLQAQIGLKKKVQSMTTDEFRQGELGMQVVDMYEEMESLRDEVGVYCMNSVRLIIPPEAISMYKGLALKATETKAPMSKGTLWSGVKSKLDADKKES